MGLNIPLLALYTLSVGSKKRRERDQAKAKAKADNKVTNWAIGPEGVRALGDNDEFKEGESAYGFSIGNSKTINQLPKEEKKFLDLFENPADKEGPLISRLDFQNLNKNTAGMDQTQQYKLGKIVGQRNPTDNTFTLLPGYERFKKPADVKNTFQQEGREVNNVFVPKKPEDTWVATHAREITKSAKENIEGRPYKLDSNKQEIELQQDGYLDSNNRFVPIGSDDLTTKATHSRAIKKTGEKITFAGIPEFKKITQEAQEVVGFYDINDKEVEFGSGTAVKSFKYKGRNEDNKPNITEAPKALVSDKDNDIVVSLDKDRKPTTDPDKEVYTQKFRFNTENPKGVPIEEPKLLKKLDKKKVPTQDFRVEIKNPNGKIVKGLASELGITKNEALQRHGVDVLITSSITTDENGIIDEKPYGNKKTSDSSNSAKAGDTYGSLTLKTTETDQSTFRKKNVMISMNRKLSGQQNLIEFNKTLLEDDSYVQQINSNPVLYQKAMSNIVSEVSRYFNDGKTGLNGVTVFKNLPKNPQDAIRTIKKFVSVDGLAKIKNFDDIVLNAAGMLGNEAAKNLMAETPVNQGEDVMVVKGKTTDGGTAMIGVNYPSDFKDIVTKKLPQYVKSSDVDQVTATIASLIKTKKNPDGTDMFVVNAEGKKVRVLDDEQGLLTFVKDLDSRAMIGKKVNINGVERNATLLDGFFSILHPYPSQAPAGSITGDDRKYILNAFTTLAANDFTEAQKLIMGFTDVNQDMVDRTIEQLHGGDTGNIKVRQEIQGKATSAFNAIITIDSMEDTYQINGRDININTQQGELIVKLSGMKETAMRGYRFLKGEKVIDIVSSSVEDVNNQLIDQDDVYDSINSNDPAEREAKAKNKAALAEIKEIMKGNLGKGTDFMQRAGIGEASGFVKSLPKSMRDAYSKGALGKDVIRKLAIRQYHKYMLAYQLAAAIQGGTGGRTISDQDVQNILSALNFGFFTEANLEKATLQEARKMMTSIYEYNNALLNKDTKVQYSAIKARELLFEGNKAPYLGIGNLGNLRGVKARRAFITNKLLNTKTTSSDTTEPKIDKEELKESQRLDDMLKLNKN